LHLSRTFHELKEVVRKLTPSSEHYATSFSPFDGEMSCFQTVFNLQCGILLSEKQTLSVEEGTWRHVRRQKTYHLIFACDGKGTTQLAHVYAETFEQASQTATQWRDEKHPDLRILKVRAEPRGFQAGPVALAGMIEEEEEGATFVDAPDIHLPS